MGIHRQFISHLRPHSPYDPPQFYWDMYAQRDLPKIPIGDWAAKHDIPQPGLERTAWRGRLTPLQNRRCRAGYMGTITHIDYELGRMMEMLGRLLVLMEISSSSPASMTATRPIVPPKTTFTFPIFFR